MSVFLSEFPHKDRLTVASVSSCCMKFQFSRNELLTSDFTRYIEVFGPTVVKSIADKSKVLGAIDFGISSLLREGKIPIDSLEFIEFCQKLRCRFGFPALTRLDTPDYPIVLCVSTPNVRFIRSSKGISIQPNVPNMQIEVKNDIMELSRYCSAAGLIDEPAAMRQYAGLRSCARNHFWPC